MRLGLVILLIVMDQLGQVLDLRCIDNKSSLDLLIDGTYDHLLVIIKNKILVIIIDILIL